MIFEWLISKDHLLVKIASIVDFSFVYDMVIDKYSEIILASVQTPFKVGDEKKLAELVIRLVNLLYQPNFAISQS